MKKWILQNKKVNIKSIFDVLLQNRGLKTKKEIDSFLNPKLSDLKIEKTGVDKLQVNKTIKRIKVAIDQKEKIIIFGDYDADGICGSAILWESISSLGGNVLPYIPSRIEEGYGISKKGILNILKKYPDTKLIITVDNGIVANEAVDFANDKNIDVIVTDHHTASSKIPKAFSIVHTTKLCGAGVAYMLSEQLAKNKKYEHLSLAAIATVADLVPLNGLNRIILKFGLEELQNTKRSGLMALIREAGIEKSTIDVFQIGHVLAPRINAMGRIDLAIESLRLLCTKDEKSSIALARKLGLTNKKRQDITFSSFSDAKTKIDNLGLKDKKLIIIGDKSYQPGVVGLIAGKLVEEFYRPSIVLSIGDKYSKASARSVSGFNIIEFIRKASDFLVDAGGHPMAAGFTVETSRIKKLSEKLEELSKKSISEKLLQRSIKIDTEIFIKNINEDFYKDLLRLAPFGVGNPQPVFLTKNLLVSEMKIVGKDGGHLSLRLVSPENKPVDAIGFNLSDKVSEVRIGDRIDIVYALDREVWREVARFKLKLRDIKKIGN